MLHCDALDQGLPAGALSQPLRRGGAAVTPVFKMRLHSPRHAQATTALDICDLECVQSELAAGLSYRRATDVLHKLLPVGQSHCASTVRAHTLRLGQRLDAEMALSQVAVQPSANVTTIGLDGGYVRHSDASVGQNFEIIAGRVLAEDGSQRSVGFVRSVDADSRIRVQHAVAALGSADEGLRVFTDGDDRLRDLQLAVLPDATHVLDWYHLTRKLTVLASVINGKPSGAELETHDQDRLSEWMDSAKWRLWHGRAPGALARLDDMQERMERLAKVTKGKGRNKPVLKRMIKLTTELRRYVSNNADSIPDYAQRYRAGDRISTAFVESAVNQIIDKRMSKSQQMRWSSQGAHLLVQVRTSVIDGRLREDFARWHPGFPANDSILQKQA